MTAGLYYVWRDFVDFLYFNKGKLILIMIIGVLGCGLGIVGAYSVMPLKALNSTTIYNFNIILFVQGKRGMASYFLVHFTVLLLVFIIMTLLSYRLILSFFNLVLFFFFCVVYARAITALIIVYKLAFLPVIIVGLIPTFILFFFCFACYCAFIMQLSYEFRYYGQRNYFACVLKTAYKGLIMCIVIFAACFIQTLLVRLLTIGIIL